MSLSSDSLAPRCKHTATDQALNNRDPLVVKKKAREAIQPDTAVPTAAKPAPTSKKGPNVCFFPF